MDTYDPFNRYVGTPEGPASLIFDITPSDDTDLVRGVKRIRIFNSLDEIAFLRLVTKRGKPPVTLAIPPLTLLWEDVRITRILETGTTAGLIIHGYSD